MMSCRNVRLGWSDSDCEELNVDPGRNAALIVEGSWEEAVHGGVCWRASHGWVNLRECPTWCARLGVGWVVSVRGIGC